MTFGIEILDEVPIASAPDAIWYAIEAELDRPPAPRRWPVAAAALAAAVLAAAIWWVAPRAPAAQWNIVRTHGARSRPATWPPAIGLTPMPPHRLR